MRADAPNDPRLTNVPTAESMVVQRMAQAVATTVLGEGRQPGNPPVFTLADADPPLAWRAREQLAAEGGADCARLTIEATPQGRPLHVASAGGRRVALDARGQRA